VKAVASQLALFQHDSHAMELGNLKHARALACMHDILRELWPAPVSIEQRYRFYRHAKVVETISRADEQRFFDESSPGDTDSGPQVSLSRRSRAYMDVLRRQERLLWFKSK